MLYQHKFKNPQEKIFAIAEPEFGKYSGYKIIIFKPLYGLK